MAYSFQTFGFGETLTSVKANQIEINVRDHKHGIDGVDGTPAMIDELNVIVASGAHIFRRVSSGNILAIRDVADSQDVFSVDQSGRINNATVLINKTLVSYFVGSSNGGDVSSGVFTTFINIDVGVVSSGDKVILYSNAFVQKLGENSTAEMRIGKADGNANIITDAASQEMIGFRRWMEGATSTQYDMTLAGIFRVTSPGSLRMALSCSTESGSLNAQELRMSIFTHHDGA